MSAWSITVYAGGVTVSPTHLFLSEQQPITLLHVVNSGNEKIFMQVDCVRWQQQAGKDHYMQTEDLLATPPVFAISPHQEQIIRFALLTNKPIVTEQNYRIFVREIMPRRVPLSSRLGHGIQLRFMLNLSIPLSRLPEVTVTQYKWLVKNVGHYQLRLTLSNLGNTTLFTNQWQLFHHGVLLVKRNVFNYLQPQQRYHWIITMRRFTRPDIVRASMNGKMVIAHIQAH